MRLILYNYFAQLINTEAVRYYRSTTCSINIFVNCGPLYLGAALIPK